ncbi:hypothetical protein MY11210_002860 [Beauveria gryllotalpidicola]
MSTFGNYFRVTTAGESHGKTVSYIIENCPPGLHLVESHIQPQLNRRRPGRSAITTPRDEKDRVTIGSGCEFGRTCDNPTGSHNASSGGGRSSARETIARVAAGAVAEKWLREAYGVELVAFVSSVGNIKLFEDRPTTDSDDIDSLSSNPKFLELVDSLTRKKDKIAELCDQHDPTGGTVTCIIRGCPSGLGEPCFEGSPRPR